MANVTQEELQQKLDELSQLLGQATVEYVQAQDYANHTELNDAVSNLQAQINAITEMDDNGVQSIAEKVQMIIEALQDGDGVVENILGRIQDNAQAIADEVARAKAAESALQSAVDAAQAKANANESAIQSANANISALGDRLGATEATLNTLTGDETVDGSIAKMVADERTRAQTKEAELQSGLDAVTSDVATVKGDLYDTTDADGNLVKGIKSRVSDLETAISQVDSGVRDYVDANFLGREEIQGLSMCASANKFRQALGLSDISCGGGDSGDGAVV